MSGLATRVVLRRQFEVFGEARFERLATISNGHVYNLRGSATYRAKRTAWTKTRATTVAIGLRQAPEPEGRPGHVRVDTVHQGDRDGVKGLYLINLVDEVTQHEFVGAAVGISERFPVPLLEGLPRSFPFPILGFRADNGSEHINHRVARCSTSCASSGSPSPAPAIPTTTRSSKARTPTWSASGSATTTSRDASRPRSTASRRARSPRSSTSTGPPVRHRAPRRQRQDPAQVPRRGRHDALRPAPLDPGAEELLKPGLGFALLDAAAVAETDLEAARRVQAERRELFLRISAGMAAARRRRMTPSRGAGRRGGPLAARAGMAPAGDTMNLTEPAKCQARTDDSGAPSPPTAWGRCAAVKGSLRRPGRLKILGEPRPDSFQSSRQPPTVIAASCPPLTAAPLRLADTLASLAPRRTGRA